MQELMEADDAVFLGEYHTVRELPLVCGPYAVPFLLNLPESGGHRVHGELYAVSERGLVRVDDLEGIGLGHYERLPIQVCPEGQEGGGGGTVVEAEAYYAHRSYAEEMWNRNGRLGFGVYTEKEATGYLERANRPKGWNFLEAIRSFVSSPSSASLSN